MTFAALLNAVSLALAPRVSEAGGVLEIAESMDEAQTFLEGSPNRWRLILHWEGFGSHPLARQGMTSHQLAAVIQQPRGLAHRPGANLTNPLPGGALPFSDRLAQVVGWMTAMRFPDGTNADIAGFSLETSQWLPTTATCRAHVLNFKLDAALPAYPLTIPLAF